jgi:hypothetical protein
MVFTLLYMHSCSFFPFVPVCACVCVFATIMATEEQPPPAKRSRSSNKKVLSRAASSTGTTSAFAQVLELGILELSYCSVKDLKSLRASCQQFKSLVHKELDRRIEQVAVAKQAATASHRGGYIFNIEHKGTSFLTGASMTSSFTLQVDWPREFSTDNGLVSEAMQYADPKQQAYVHRPSRRGKCQTTSTSI